METAPVYYGDVKEVYMGLFDKLFGKGKKKDGYSFIADIAKLIAPESGVSEKLSGAFAEPYEYFIKVEWQLDARGLVIGMVENKKLFWISLVDELAAKGCVFEVDYKCELEDFLDALKRINSYDTIKTAVEGIQFDENEDAEKWGAQINSALGDTAAVCCFDIDSDSYPLVILSGEILPQVQKLAEDNGHKIVRF